MAEKKKTEQAATEAAADGKAGTKKESGARTMVLGYICGIAIVGIIALLLNL